MQSSFKGNKFHSINTVHYTKTHTQKFFEMRSHRSVQAACGWELNFSLLVMPVSLL